MYDEHLVEVDIEHRLSELVKINFGEWLGTNNGTIDNNVRERNGHGESRNVRISEKSVSDNRVEANRENAARDKGKGKATTTMGEDDESEEKIGEEGEEAGIEDLDLDVYMHELNKEHWVNV